MCINDTGSRTYHPSFGNRLLLSTAFGGGSFGPTTKGAPVGPRNVLVPGATEGGLHASSVVFFSPLGHAAKAAAARTMRMRKTNKIRFCMALLYIIARPPQKLRVQLCPQEELNLYLSLRRATLDPLSYGDIYHTPLRQLRVGEPTGASGLWGLCPRILPEFRNTRNLPARNRP